MIGTEYGESNNRKRIISLVTYYYIMTAPLKTGRKKTDFQEGKLVKTDIEGKSVVLVMLNGKLFAMDSVCSHEGGPLEDGLLEGYNLIRANLVRPSGLVLLTVNTLLSDR
jgi:hypothetical protein